MWIKTRSLTFTEANKCVVQKVLLCVRLCLADEHSSERWLGNTVLLACEREILILLLHALLLKCHSRETHFFKFSKFSTWAKAMKLVLNMRNSVRRARRLAMQLAPPYCRAVVRQASWACGYISVFVHNSSRHVQWGEQCAYHQLWESPEMKAGLPWPWCSSSTAQAIHTHLRCGKGSCVSKGASFSSMLVLRVN